MFRRFNRDSEVNALQGLTGKVALESSDNSVAIAVDGNKIDLKAAGGGSGVSLETNGTPNTDQAVLNLINGTNVTITADGSGGVTISSSGGGGGSVPQATFQIMG